MNMLKPKLECDLYEDVLPWLMAKKEAYTGDQEDAAEIAE